MYFLVCVHFYIIALHMCENCVVPIAHIKIVIVCTFKYYGVGQMVNFMIGVYIVKIPL